MRLKAVDRRKGKWTLLPLMWMLVTACGTPGVIRQVADTSLSPAAEKLRERIVAYQRQLSVGDSTTYRTAFNMLKMRADEALDVQPPSVLHKTEVAPSGDPHDYFSLAPYWWPDPERADGLPWIRRDGEINPATRGSSTDIEAKNRMRSHFQVLAQASLLTEDPRYGERADQLLYTWFVDPATRMNPHLNYAQGIPGRNDGRGFGIIEWAGLAEMLPYVELLADAGSLRPETALGFRRWAEAYSEWLRTSEFGHFEATRKNNHATWYDVQRVALHLFLGEEEAARRILKRVGPDRIATQIEPDGRQLHELERTKSLTYSTMNLRAFTRLAYYGKLVGVDPWSYASEDGRSLVRAYEFLEPYVIGTEKWAWPQLGDREHVRLESQSLFIEAGCLMGEEAYRKKGSMAPDGSTEMLLLLAPYTSE